MRRDTWRGAAAAFLKGPSLGAVLGLACLLLWYDLAFRLEPMPAVVLDVSFLRHPRTDLGWLCALTAAALASVVALGMRRTPAPTALAPDRRPAVELAVGCGLGTALVQLGAVHVGLPVAGGTIAGACFGLLATHLARSAPVSPTMRQIATHWCAAVGAAAVAKAVVLTPGALVTPAAMCLLPLVATLLLERSARRLANVLASRPEGAPKADVAALQRTKGNLTSVVFCFLGIGLFMGIIGFYSDDLPLGEYRALQLTAGVVGGLLGCLVFAVALRTDPDAPYVLLPILLGTLSLVFLLTALGHMPSGPLLTRIGGTMVDDVAFALAGCLACEFGRSQSNRRTATPEFVMAACALALLASILLGGVVMSTAGLNTVSVAVTAASLVYGALLGLGMATQQRNRSNYVVVRSLADMDYIAERQARAIAEELGTLTPREAEVLPYLLKHQSAEVIADKLGISRNTVKTHMAHIYEKAAVNTRQQLVDYAAAKTIQL